MVNTIVKLLEVRIDASLTRCSTGLNLCRVFDMGKHLGHIFGGKAGSLPDKVLHWVRLMPYLKN
jgi:hypothetical protein